MKASLSITLHHYGSDNECGGSSSGNSIHTGSNTHVTCIGKENGNDNGFNGNKRSRVVYRVYVECEPRGSDEIVELLRFYEVYPH